MAKTPAATAKGKKASAAKSKKPAAKKPAEERDDGRRTPTVGEQAARNTELVAAKLRGLDYPELAETFDLTERRCRQIVDEYRKSNPTLRVHDPIEVADELLEGYKADLSELVTVGATTDNDNAKIKAVNARVNIRKQVTVLLQALGVLPHDLSELRIEIDARVTAQKVVAVLGEFDVPEALTDRLIEVLEGTATEITDETLALTAG